MITIDTLLTPVIQDAIMNDEMINKLMERLNRLYLNAIPIGIKHNNEQVIIRYSEQINKADAEIKKLIEERKKQIINAYMYSKPNGR